MDYDYDHLLSGIDKLLGELNPLIQKASYLYDDDYASCDWLEFGENLIEKIILFPEGGPESTMNRVKIAVDICGDIRKLDCRIIGQSSAELLALTLEDDIGKECDAMEKYYGITVPWEIRHPSKQINNSESNFPVIL